ncbi:hypothetical protein PV371_26680 [Streptomyces sp. TX20-6-3]|uniref:hypothetical protein n=1 Tax=Streptomyces sp. TX20-6-3 TaxID=3028705 RepID=UPI0029AE91BE|nr:hypothetical protein [Streptomyces sp. TX20-6-3]MDX2563223.1 hypothetical protein [Streptomyces sp. TX20-6-3]
MKERANEDARRRRTTPTTPAGAEGESGDKEAREEAEEAVAHRAGDTDREGADGHRAKRQRPGLGREEQTRGQGE